MPTTYEQHKDLVGAVQAEATYGGERNLPSAAFGFSPVTLNIDPEINEEAHPDHTGRMVFKSTTVHGTRVNWDASFAIEPSGTAGTPSDASVFFAKGMFNSALYNSAAVVVNSGGSTTTKVQMSNIGLMTTGMVIPIETTSSSERYRCRIVHKVSSIGAGSAGLVHFWPALPSAPVSGAKVGKSLTYGPDNTCENGGTSFTAWRWGTNTVKKVYGGVVQNYSWSWGNNTHPQVQLQGFGKGYRQGAKTTLAGALVSGADRFSAVDHQYLTEGIVVQVEDEAILLGPKSSDGTFTLSAGNRGVLGTTADAHLAAVTVSAYKPTMTLAGRPLRSPNCTTTIGWTSSTCEEMEGTDGTATIADGLVPDEQLFGSEWVVAGYGKADGDLEPEVSITGRLKAQTFEQYEYARDASTNKGVVVQWGLSAGRMAGLVFPWGKVAMFEETMGDGKGSVGAKVMIKARGARTGLDAFYYFEA